jgi:hypothetical protein
MQVASLEIELVPRLLLTVVGMPCLDAFPCSIVPKTFCRSLYTP